MKLSRILRILLFTVLSLSFIVSASTPVSADGSPPPPGTPWGWGYNIRGQLGDGNGIDRHTPVQVANLSNVTVVAGGAFHSLALRSDGTVWAWGNNAYGQLGDGVGANRYFPAQVVGLSNVTDIAVGHEHSLAIRSDGSVWAWGRNDFGQLGDGSTTHRNVPVQVTGLSNVTAVGAGQYHSLALTSDGTVLAWGSNGYGQLGDSTLTTRFTPVHTTGLSNVAAVAAGSNHSLALNSDGTVRAWGQNNLGQLGDGSTTRRNAPVQVTGLSNVTAVGAGQYHSLAITSNGAVRAWGYNNYGQLGDGTWTTRLTPVQVTGLSNITAIAAGYGHSLALNSDGTVSAWGWDWYGQLGVGHLPSPYYTNTPVQVSGLSDVTAIGAGSSHSLAIVADNQPPIASNDSYSTNEGTPLTISSPGVIVNDSDPDSNPLTAILVSRPAHGLLNLNSNGSFSYTPDVGYTGPDSFTYKANDEQSASNVATVGITVIAVNEAPVMDNPWKQSNFEGDIVSLQIVASDPDGDALDYSASGLPPGLGIDSAGLISGTLPYTASGSYDITVSTSDGSMSVTQTFVWTVANLNRPPTVSDITAPVDPVDNAILINTSATFSDPDVGDTHTGIWDWGDSATSAANVNETTGTAAGSHQYQQPGVYDVRLTVIDGAGTTAQAVYHYVVAYDPSAGFVTGGGWINSPTGAYTPDPALAGKATFGFISKYQKGVFVPFGQTEFQFRVASLNFHSEKYEWLVVAGAKAQYKGEGTINGAGNYRFMIAAIDGDLLGDGNRADKFRIMIWDDVGLIYDNQLVAPVTDDPTTVLGGGSIVIHK